MSVSWADTVYHSYQSFWFQFSTSESEEAAKDHQWKEKKKKKRAEVVTNKTNMS